MKHDYVGYYSEKNHIKNTMKIFKFVGSYLNIIGCSTKQSAEHSELGNTSENVELENSLDENNNNIPFDSECSNSDNGVKYSDNLEERPSNKDLYNILNHVLGITKEGFDDMLNELSFYIEHYLLKYEYEPYSHFRCRDRPVCTGTKYRTWYKSMHHIEVSLSYTDMEHTLYCLVNDGASIDEMKNYIHVFVKYYDTLKNDLFIEHKNIFKEGMKNPQRLYILTKFKCI
ncbi:Plasmodium exported protein (PHISTa), unknown, putative [Plasmodium sp.]|nr:Plasmodium exported protein (PHISTa), unknown, putative [Plasmodium sp.]